MKRISIYDLEALENELNEVQKKARQRVISVSHIQKAVQDIENHLNLPKKYLLGIKAVVDVNATKYPNAYKYSPQATFFEVIYNYKGWQVTKIYRDNQNKYKDDKFTCDIPEETKNYIIKRALQEAISF